MAKVLLANHWFTRFGYLIRKSVTKRGPPVEVPDELIDELPSTAKVVDDDYVTPEPVRVPDTLSEHQKMLSAHDPARAAAESQGAAVAEADRTLAENRAKFQEDLTAEEVVKLAKKGQK